MTPREESMAMLFPCLAGGMVAGLVLIALIGLALWLWERRREGP